MMDQPSPQNSRKPRYLALADDLREQIVRGDFPQPDQFPTESTLCTRYGVSRFTVREALRQLQNEGLIQRKRGSGTVIQPASARGGALHQPLSNVGELLQYARDTSFLFERAGSVVLPKPISEQLGMTVPGKWARFRGIRSGRGDALPIALTDAYIHPSLSAEADRIDTAGTTIFRQVEMLSAVPIRQVTQDIQAVAANADVAAALRVPRRSPCLRILRCYHGADGRILEISASHHPGDRFAYAMHIEVEG
jgi:GntR family transcriptional regulator